MEIKLLFRDDIKKHRIIAEKLCEELSGYMGNNVEITLHTVSSEAEMASFLDEVDPETCGLIATIDLTGYEMETTGGIASINQMPLDIVNVITCSSDADAGKGELSRKQMESLLKKNHSYMSHFVFTDEATAEWVRDEFPHLWHVVSCRNAADIASYIADLKLRYNGAMT